MSPAIKRHYQRRYEAGLDVLGDAGFDMNSILSMFTAGMGSKPTDKNAEAAKAVAAALAKQKAEEEAKQTKMFAIGGFMLAGLGVAYVVLKKK